MHHSLSLKVQYPTQRCGTAEGTNQQRTRMSFAFDHTIFLNLVFESKLDETPRPGFTSLITEMPEIRALYYGGDVRVKR